MNNQYPLSSLFNHITTTHLKGDLMGGLTAAIVSLPLALAFGVASGAGPEAKASGNDTLAAVRPPIRSPFRCDVVI